MGHPQGREARRERNARALAARAEDRTATRDSRTALQAERITVNGRSWRVTDLARAIDGRDAS